MVTLRSGATVTTFALADVEPDFARAEVRFEGLSPPARSFELRVFAGAPNADARTATEGNPHYLGSQWFYGVGGDGGGALDDVADAGQQFAPTQIRLNVTDGLRALLAQGETGALPVTLVAVDRDGNELAEPGLRFEGLSLVTS